MTATTYYIRIESPLGELLATSDGLFITGLYLPQHKRGRSPDASWQQSDGPFIALREQLAEYFAGARRDFDVPVRLVGTPFQQRVWQELVNIPFGTTISYAMLAERVGQPTASRAVGNANARNPVSLVIPCHRVIGSTGKPTGYAGGIAKKEWLLAWERECLCQAYAVT